MTRLQNDQVRLRNENAEIETEIDELKRKIAKYTTMWNSLPKKPKLQDTLIVKQPIKQEIQEPSKSVERIQNRPPNALDLLIGSPSSYSSGCSDQEMFVPEQVNGGYGHQQSAVAPLSPQLPLEIVQTIEDLQNDKKFNTPIHKPKKSAFFSAL